MDRLALEIEKTTNWKEAYPVMTATATPINSRSYTPIPEMVIPLLMTVNTLAVLVTSNTALSYQVYAGLLLKSVRTGIQPGGLADTQSQDAKKIFLNRITLVRFDKVSETYKLSFKPSWKLNQINLYVWEYTGLERDLTDRYIVGLTAQVQALSKKLDKVSGEIKNSIASIIDPFNFL